MKRDPLAMTEKAWMAHVIRLAALCGFGLRYHVLHSIGSAAGFPDLVLVRRPGARRKDEPARLLYVECKGDRGKMSPAQKEWLDALAACGCETYCWRPADLDAVVACLERS